MDSKELQRRIDNKQEQISKIERRVAKWSNKCTNVELNLANNNYTTPYKDWIALLIEVNVPVTEPLRELRSALIDLNEARVLLDKYNNQLNLVIDRENAVKIPALEEFFEGYRKEVTKYIERNVNYLLEYYELNREYCQFFNNHFNLIDSGEYTKESYKERLEELKELEKKAKSKVNPITLEVFSRNAINNINYDKLNEILDKDIDAKYWTLIERATKITGEITDASCLSVGYDGNLNGSIKGIKGKAWIETISAGGYNQDVIVNVKHGQIFHYRLLVKEMKDSDTDNDVVSYDLDALNFFLKESRDSDTSVLRVLLLDKFNDSELGGLHRVDNIVNLSNLPGYFSDYLISRLEYLYNHTVSLYGGLSSEPAVGCDLYECMVDTLAKESVDVDTLSKRRDFVQVAGIINTLNKAYDNSIYGIDVVIPCNCLYSQVSPDSKVLFASSKSGRGLWNIKNSQGDELSHERYVIMILLPKRM